MCQLLLTATDLQITEKQVILPALRGCAHGLSLQYPSTCAINCPLYQNPALHGKLPLNFWQSYDLQCHTLYEM